MGGARDARGRGRGRRAPGGRPADDRADTPIPPTDIPLQGHIDDPRREGGRIVELDTTAGPRLAKVDVEGSGGRFIAWVSPAEEAFARAQGNSQPGGIVHMDVCDITDMPWQPGLGDHAPAP